MLKRLTLATAGTALLLSSAAFAQDDWYPSKHGKDDQAGQSNLMTPDRVKAAMKYIKQGKVISLARTYSDKMPLFGHRKFATRGTNGLSGGPLAKIRSSGWMTSSQPKSPRLAPNLTVSGTSASATSSTTVRRPKASSEQLA